ncbi:MAG: hypothetical protein O3A93_08255 [Chloroflexi bacterium]|nr:hypothetical protein [Chloroflexota bacterium]MDA1271237.1 hypothetical protein [Chloroflexota bacterium]
MPLAVFAVVLAACTSGPTPPEDLLLAPGDFPGQEITVVSREAGETAVAEPAVQVELAGPDFLLLESLVLFQREDLALMILKGIKQDQISQGVTANPAEGFEDNTGVLGDRLNGEDASTVFFTQGRALVRLTLTGPGNTAKIWEIARLAREKSRP